MPRHFRRGWLEFMASVGSGICIGVRFLIMRSLRVLGVWTCPSLLGVLSLKLVGIDHLGCVVVSGAPMVSDLVHLMRFARVFRVCCRVFMMLFGVTMPVWHANSCAVNSLPCCLSASCSSSGMPSMRKDLIIRAQFKDLARLTKPVSPST